MFSHNFNYQKKILPALFLSTSLLFGTLTPTASAATVFPGDPAWGNPAGENGAGGSSAITNTAPRDGNGSVEIHGDRTRFVGLGNFYSPASNLMLLSQVDLFTFDWMIDPGSTSNLHTDYTPALRLHIWDGNQRSEIIWEGAYNGTYGNTTKGDWYTTGANDLFWRHESGLGLTLDGGAQVNISVADWADPTNGWYSADAYVAAISVGAGSSVGSGYISFADNVTLNNDVFNFETRAKVPEPATAALFGFGLFALIRRKNKQS